MKFPGQKTRCPECNQPTTSLFSPEIELFDSKIYESKNTSPQQREKSKSMKAGSLFHKMTKK